MSPSAFVSSQTSWTPRRMICLALLKLPTDKRRLGERDGGFSIAFAGQRYPPRGAAAPGGLAEITAQTVTAFSAPKSDGARGCGVHPKAVNFRTAPKQGRRSCGF